MEYPDFNIEELKERFETVITQYDKEQIPQFVDVLKDCLFGECRLLQEEVMKVLTTGQINKRVIEINDLNELPPIIVYPYEKLFNLALEKDMYELALYVYEKFPYYAFILEQASKEIGKFVYEKIKNLPLVEAQQKSKDFPYITVLRSVMKDLLPVLKLNGEELHDSFEENYDVAEYALESGYYNDETPNLDEIEEFFEIELNEEEKKQAELDKIVEILNELDELEEEIDSP